MRQHGTSRAFAVDRTLTAALLTAFLLHNLEEALAFGRYRDRSQVLVRSLGFPGFSAPSTDAFHLALVIVSLAATLAMAWALLRPASRGALLMVRSLAAVMLANVILPHVPAAMLLGGYAPGVATAVLVNLPIATLVLIRTRRGWQ